MKLFLKKLFALVERLGTARAAAQLASMGYMAEAKALMLEHQKAVQTYKELSRLTDKELNDIGINRGDIHRIAFERTA